MGRLCRAAHTRSQSSGRTRCPKRPINTLALDASAEAKIQGYIRTLEDFLLLARDAGAAFKLANVTVLDPIALAKGNMSMVEP